ncbi:MAG TPA: helical backbone metal receptor, partial [Candidatus Competibacteraceae bacterium]|nr:helical backbone metal receptor [Candidatus Competibacteraceae bacterium]
MSASSCALIDAVGVCHRPASGAVRIACLVPSITELLFALGLGTQLVARTRFCIHPAAAVAAVPSVGGTKKIKHRLLRELTPSHVILNIDENPRTMAEELASYVPHLIVTHPQAPQDNLHLYRLLGGIFQRQAAAEALARRFAAALAALRARPHPPRRG